MGRSPSPPELVRVQRWLADVLTEPRGVSAALSRRPEGAPWIVEAPPIDRHTRLAVYADGYFERLLEVLASDYRAVKRAVGERAFRELAAGFLSRIPSTSPNVTDLGGAFPTFLRKHPVARTFGFLPDLALLERSALERLYRDRLPAFTPEATAALPADAWAASAIALDTTVDLLRLRWPVHRLWRSRDESGRAGRTLRRPAPTRLLVWRDDWVRVEELDAKRWDLLCRLRAGETLGASLSRVNASASEVQRWFSDWISNGVVKGVRR
ncbi:MAG: putative DNA-binding domain-containing protein [Elusimicrobia bacterium]|nr:putative DNA-binding domain-containing protein [Elusimicrobiota bacterium]